MTGCPNSTRGTVVDNGRVIRLRYQTNMSFINNLARKFFGSKADKDIEEIQPYVEKIAEVSSQLQSISDDALRGKTAEFKQQIADHLKDERAQIDELAKKADDPQTQIEEKEDLYEQIDKIEEKVTEKIEEVLLDILPSAFAVVKETARRLKDNGAITVTATEMDRDLAANKGYVSIDGDKATFPKTWDAGGTEVSWHRQAQY